MKQFEDMRKMMRTMNKMSQTKGGMAQMAKMMGGMQRRPRRHDGPLAPNTVVIFSLTKKPGQVRPGSLVLGLLYRIRIKLRLVKTKY